MRTYTITCKHCNLQVSTTSNFNPVEGYLLQLREFFIACGWIYNELKKYWVCPLCRERS